MDIAIDFIEPHGIKAVRNGLQTEKVKNNDDDLKLRKENKIKRKEQKKKDRKEKKRENSKRKNKDKQLRKNGKLDNTEIDVSLTTIKHSPDGNLSFLQSQNSGNNTISERPSANLPPKEFSDNVKNVKIKKNDGIHIISHEYVKNLIKKAFEAREKSPEAKLSKPIPLSIVTSTEPNKLRSTSMPTATTDSMTGTDNLKTNVPNEPQVSPIISEFTTKESNHPTAESTTTKETVTKSFSTLLPTSGKQTSKPIHISTTERTQQIIPEAGNEKKTEISSATKTPEVTTAKLSDDVAITFPNLTNIQSTEVEKHPEIITTNVTKKSTTTEKTTEMKTQPEIKTTNVTKQTTSFETATILPSSVTQLESFTNDTSSTFTAKNIDTNVPDDNKEIDKTESSNTKMDNIPKKAHSGSVVIQENKNSNSTKADDIDIIIFPSSRADKRRRKQERRRLCANIENRKKMDLKSADVLQPRAMFNNKPIISPDEIRKLLERMNDKVKQIHKLGQQVLNGSTTSKPTTQPVKESTTKLIEKTTTDSTILNGTLTNNQNTTNGFDNQNLDNNYPKVTVTTTLALPTKTRKTDSTTVYPNNTTESIITTNTTVTTINPKGTSFKSDITVYTNETLNSDGNDSDTTTPETVISDDEDKIAQNAATKDDDVSIFRTSEADRKQRKKEIRMFCAKIDFGDAKKGFQCCKKTLNCFDDLPENIDETVFHNGHHEYNEAKRLHVCHHIDEALVCKDGVFNRSVCKNVNPIMEGKIKPQLDKVKLFYYNHCNRGTAITPTGGYPSHKPHPHVPPTGPGGTGSEQYHSHTNSYAPYIGGAIMGVFALVIIVLFAIYCRKRVNKRKRNKEQRNDPGRESTQSSRYKTVSYNRRKSDVYAEIDEKSMISSVSYNIDGHSCSTDVTNLSHSNTSSFSRKYQSAPSIRQLELDNHGYLSPESIMPEDELKSNIADENTSTHGYIELKSESGDSGQSYAKLEPEPEDEYIQADEIESTPIKKKKPDEQGHMYFVLEKENEESNKVPDQ